MPQLVKAASESRESGLYCRVERCPAYSAVESVQRIALLSVDYSLQSCIESGGRRE